MKKIEEVMMNIPDDVLKAIYSEFEALYKTGIFENTIFMDIVIKDIVEETGVPEREMSRVTVFEKVFLREVARRYVQKPQ